MSMRQAYRRTYYWMDLDAPKHLPRWAKINGHKIARGVGQRALRKEIEELDESREQCPDPLATPTPVVEAP